MKHCSIYSTCTVRLWKEEMKNEREWKWKDEKTDSGKEGNFCCGKTRVLRRKMRKAANVIRRTRCNAGGNRCQFQSSGQRILEQDSGFWGPDLTLVRNNTVALVFNSAAFKVAGWRRHRCRCTAPDFVPCSEQPSWIIFRPKWQFQQPFVEWNIGNTCWVQLVWVMIKFALVLASYDNLAMLTALRIVNIFLSPRRPMNYCHWSSCPLDLCNRHPRGESSASPNPLR
jgi:hypothetical protein